MCLSTATVPSLNLSFVSDLLISLVSIFLKNPYLCNYSGFLLVAVPSYGPIGCHTQSTHSGNNNRNSIAKNGKIFNSAYLSVYFPPHTLSNINNFIYSINVEEVCDCFYNTINLKVMEFRQIY